ncbi:GspE/PulE family protein [Phenylobacterium sp.]|uniref:GspE/PulE family protein n=1 Tax=Phenylobacterium sp. TaxID=1871053 RepID=UPI0011F88F14|nr:GspE/PulE family protein [Phenylobacterium sp.]THD60653.1 MAG: type II/IV secretion system protein [Phenylobacterium sp.]
MDAPASTLEAPPPGLLGLEALVESRGLVAPETLARARIVQAETGERFHSVLTRLGLVSEQALAQLIAEAASLPIASASDYPALPLATDRVSERFLREFKAVLLRETDRGFDAAMVDPLDPYPRRALAFALGAPVTLSVARASDVEAALERLYGAQADDAFAIDGEADLADLERLKDMASDAPAIRAINRLIARAVEERASDIHLEAAEDSLTVRFRVDGEMHNLEAFPAAMRAPIVSRIKVMAGLNIAERRAPQDGRLRLAVRGHDIDLRVATSPTINGESVVLRLLDRTKLTLDFTALGFDGEVLAKLRETLARPNGVVLVTGPTGSGKTTTLYAALNELNTPQRKILTIEDPIEYRLAGVNQMQVNPAIGLNFAAALRSFLRQDPDVMMVGEVRDLETARVAVQAALTGHMILSTLHTNSAASSVTRLLDMGIEPFLITSTLNAVLAQRLVRRLCESCREPYAPIAPIETRTEDGEVRRIEIDRLYHPKGCPACGGTGFHGRVALVELLVMDAEIARLVLDRAEAREIAAAALAGSMRSMLSDGVMKAWAGITTLEEVLRVTGET